MFGQQTGTSPFGAPASTPFGAPAANAFGAPAAAPTSAFGAPAPAPGGFGGFGSPAPAPAASGFGGFGAPAPAPAGFGGGGFGSPAPSAFGAAAPASTPFGAPAPAPTGGLFGAAPVAPAATPSTGLFGAPAPTPSAFGAAPPPSTGFGGFGAPAATTATPAFGAPAAAGAFGAAPAPAAGGLFGSPAPAPAFGAPASTGFGAAPAPATGLFGAPAPAPAAGGLFGAPAPAVGMGGQGGGSRMAPFVETRKVDGSSNISFQSITAMPVYEGKTFEELRMEDYMAGNKGSQGQPAPAAMGGFGAAAPAPAAGGLFGSAPAPAPATGFGFGSSPAPAAGGLFGAPAPAPAAGGLFGGGAPAPAAGGLFGGGAPAPAAGGLFGSPAPAPSAFGAPAPATGFGATPAPAAGGFGFGASPAAAPVAGGLFGAPAIAPAAGGLFGAPAPAPAAGGLFGGGAPAPAAGGLFGAPAPAPAAGGLFGAPAPAAGGFGFGASPAPAPVAGGLFGAPAPAPAAGGLFGSPAPAPSAFGAPAPSAYGAPPAPTPGAFSFGAAPAPAPVGGLFGSPAPAAGGLFGAPAPAAGGLFGGTLAAPPPATGGFYGAPVPAAANIGMAGATTILVPPAAETLLAQQMAAIQNQNDELKVMELWRGSLNSPKKKWSSADNGSARTVSTSVYQRDAAAVKYRGLAGSTSSSSSSATVLNSYHAAPRSAAKIRPRGFGPAKSSLGNLSGRGQGMLSPSALLGSSTKQLVIKPDALIPKPRTKLLLSDNITSTETVEQTETPTIDLTQGTRNIHNGMNSATPPARLNLVDGNLPFENSRIASEKAGFASPGVSKETSTPPSKVTPIPESSQKKKNAATPADESYDFYKSVIGSPSGLANGEGVDNSFSSPPANERTNVADSLPQLTKPGYAMTPSLDALSRLSEADLAAVPNFVVEKIGIGSVAWVGAVDIRGIDLDAVISIEPKAVEVYHQAEEEGSKPAVGTKLNRPAIITLHDVFPKNGPESTEEEKDKFEKKIEKKTKQMGASFILMDASIGVWKFQVEHFSRYALDDDDSDDGEDEIDVIEINEAEAESAEKLDFDKGVRGGRALSSQQVPWSSMEGQTRFHVPDNDDDINMGERENKLIIRSEEMNKIQAAESAYEQMISLQNMDMQEYDTEKEEHKSCYMDEGITNTEHYGNDFVPLPPLPLTNVNICAQIARRCGVKKATSSATDFGMRMGRSFRVGWGPDGSHIYPSDFGESRATGDKFITRSKLPYYPYDNLISLHLSQSVNISHESDCPIFTIPSSAIDKLNEAYILSSKKIASESSGNDLHTIMSQSFALISILFSNAPSERKDEAFAMWLREACAIEVEREVAVSDNYYASIFAALSGDDFSRAASIARKNGNHMLALMITNASSTSSYLLSDQLKMWNDSGAIKKFPMDLVRIYSLLTQSLEFEEDLYKETAGNPSVPSLDWKRRMAMLFRSMSSDSHPLDDAIISSLVAKYESGIKEGIAPPTQAWFLQKCTGTDYSDELCVLFRLLKVFCNLELIHEKVALSTVISPSGHNPDEFDLSMSFHMAALLSSRGICGNLTDAEECEMLNSFASQLLSSGMWEWAVYVSLCCFNASGLSDQLILAKEKMAKDIVLKHYSSDSKECQRRRSFLEDKVGIPSSWFEMALSNRAIYDGNAEAFFKHSISTNDQLPQQYEELILPNALFNGGLSNYRSIVQTLDGMQIQHTDHSTLRGTVYDYLKLLEDVAEMSKKDCDSDSNFDDLIANALNIQKCLKKMKGDTPVPWKLFSGISSIPKAVTLTELSSSLTVVIGRLYDMRAGRFVDNRSATNNTLVTRTGKALPPQNDVLFFEEHDPRAFLRKKFAIVERMSEGRDVGDSPMYRPQRFIPFGNS
uniref:Peptidase S59 domain-containing protein n=1 Tax=Chaetoceros debilis TaxID=122233 RepID=A0A7S3QAT4_9STRA